MVTRRGESGATEAKQAKKKERKKTVTRSDDADRGLTCAATRGNTTAAAASAAVKETMCDVTAFMSTLIRGPPEMRLAGRGVAGARGS